MRPDCINIIRKKDIGSVNRHFNRKKGVIMKKWRCTSCDYIYDPAEGDEEGGIEPGTSFEDLPEDWVCPICGAAKADFEKLS
jgi:rubredoxin